MAYTVVALPLSIAEFSFMGGDAWLITEQVVNAIFVVDLVRSRALDPRAKAPPTRFRSLLPRALDPPVWRFAPCCPLCAHSRGCAIAAALRSSSTRTPATSMLPRAHS